MEPKDSAPAKEVVNETEERTDMCRIGYVGDNEGFEVYVRTDDMEQVPHFHVRDAATRGRKFETCVQLETNKYLLHGECKDTMNDSLRRALADFMASESKCIDGITNYEVTVMHWNLNNSDAAQITHEDGQRLAIPNYRETSPDGK